MEINIDIRYTETFDQATNNIVIYLAPHSTELNVIRRLEKLIKKFELKVSISPQSCPVSSQLLEIGVASYREFNSDGFRILYRIIEEDKKQIVECGYILNQKQDVQKALIDHCLLYK